MAGLKTKIASNNGNALSARERELVCLICTGLLTNEAAWLMHISTQTAATHRNNAMRKLGLDSAVKLTHWAIANGLVKVMTFGEAPRPVKPVDSKKSVA